MINRAFILIPGFTLSWLCIRDFIIIIIILGDFRLKWVHFNRFEYIGIYGLSWGSRVSLGVPGGLVWGSAAGPGGFAWGSTGGPPAGLPGGPRAGPRRAPGGIIMHLSFFLLAGRFSIGCGSKFRAEVAYLEVGSSDLKPIHEKNHF